jgi:transcriptional regulator with XRE-family HTH domain
MAVQEIPVSIRRKLVDEKDRLKLSYEDLEKLTGIASSSLQRYLAGETKKFPMDAFRVICDALNMDPATVLGWKRPEAVVSTDPWDPNDMGWADKEDEATRIMARGMAKMSPENRRKLVEVAKLMFVEDFDEEGNKRK